MPLPNKLPRARTPKHKSDKRILVNRYTVEKRLGAGKFGTAWMVTDRKTKDDQEKCKVVKEIGVGDLAPDETVDAMHEAALLRSLDHPGIVKFHDSFVDGESFFLVTEYCEGGDLQQKVTTYKKRNEFIPEPLIIEWVIQLLLALKYMHSRLVLHRDLKSSNIFLRRNRVKIGDFGISRILMGTNDMASTFTGTPFYMSPEVIKHEGYNSKSDIWSIGCILFDLVSLRHAFEGQSIMGVMYNIVEGELPAWPKNYSKQLKSVFHSLMKKEPSDRPSADDALKLPLIVSQMEQLTHTMLDKHNNKFSHENINKETQDIISASKEKSSISNLKRISDEHKWKNLTPRERARLRRQQQADAQAQKIRNVTQQQLLENKEAYSTIKENMNAYKSKIFPWEEKQSEDNVDLRPVTASAGGRFQYRVSEIADDHDEGSSTDDDADVYYTVPEMKSSPLSEGTLVAPKFGTFQPDNRPITPMKNRMVYNVNYSSLDFKDGIPEEPKLAETFYSQYEDFEEEEEEGEDDFGEGDETIVASPVVADGEVEDLISYMQSALNQSDNDTVVLDQTITDDTIADAFGPIARETKIRNLRAECIKKFGEKEFKLAYDYLKNVRFNGVTGGHSVNEHKLMSDLKEIVTNPRDCFEIDQLLFLEEQSRLSHLSV